MLYYTFRSITRAQLAQRALREAGVSAALLRTPKALAAEGCGYALRLPRAEETAADRAFRDAPPYQRKFLEQNGRYLEVRDD